jgi:hypothetical protein
MRKALPILTMMTLAMLGCTMNRTPGNGQPDTNRPYFNPADTYGSSSGNVPMTSSYLAPSTSAADRAAYAADIMRQHQLYQPRVLGYLSPEPRADQQQAVDDQPTGQYINPSLTANPELTVNSSISSEPVPVITGGDAVAVGSTGGFVVPGGSAGVTNAATVATPTATTAPLTVGSTVGTIGATNAGTTGATVTTNTNPTGVITAGPATANAITAGGRAPLTPTISSGALPSPNAVSGISTAIRPTGMASAFTPNAAPTTVTNMPSTTGSIVAPSTLVNRTAGTTTITSQSTVNGLGTARLTMPTSRVTTTLPLTVTTTPTGRILITNVHTPGR